MNPYARFQKPIPMPINLFNSPIIGNADMIRLDPNQLSIPLMSLVNSEIPVPLACLKQQP